MSLALAWDLAVGGVNHSIEGNGGEDCIAYIPLWQKVLETLVVVPLGAWLIWEHGPRLDASFPVPPKNEPHSRYTVLCLYSLVFGAELAFKMISRTSIFLFNPCHLATVMQLALLSMDSSKRETCALFRLQMYFMPGALFALLFPILNTRLLPGEVFIYYVQHGAILIIPAYLIYLKGAFHPEPISDMTWPLCSLSFMVFYHFIPLQLMSLYTGVNLNNIMCPAVSDPFKSRVYRLFACMHQSLLVPLIVKSYYLVVGFALRFVPDWIGALGAPQKTSVVKTD